MILFNLRAETCPNIWHPLYANSRFAESQYVEYIGLPLRAYSEVFEAGDCSDGERPSTVGIMI